MGLAGMASGQLNDLELAGRIIGQEAEKLDSILSGCGYDYTITNVKGKKRAYSHVYTIYIDSRFGGIKKWEVTSVYPQITTSVMGEETTEYLTGQPEYICEIFVRYRHSNTGDLKDFKSYSLPENGAIKYEKEMGSDLSHLKLSFQKEPN